MTTIYRDITTGEELSDRDLHIRYNDMLDDVYDTVNICGLEYTPSHALMVVDPIAYRVGFSEWLDSEIDNTIEEVEG